MSLMGFYRRKSSNEKWPVWLKFEVKFLPVEHVKWYSKSWWFSKKFTEFCRNLPRNFRYAGKFFIFQRVGIWYFLLQSIPKLSRVKKTQTLSFNMNTIFIIAWHMEVLNYGKIIWFKDVINFYGHLVVWPLHIRPVVKMESFLWHNERCWQAPWF